MRDDLAAVLNERFSSSLNTEGVITLLFILMFFITAVLSVIIFSGTHKLRGYHSILYRDIRLSAIIPIPEALLSEKQLKTLKSTIDSLLSQNYPADEIIIVSRYPLNLKEYTDNERIIPILFKTIPPKWNPTQFLRYKGAMTAKGNFLLFLSSDCLFAPEGLTEILSYYQEESKETVLSVIPAAVNKGLSPTAQIANLFTPAACNCTTHLKRTGMRSILTESMILCSSNSYKKAGTHLALRNKKNQNSALTQEFYNLNIKIETQPGYPLITRPKNNNAMQEYLSVIKGNYKNLITRKPYTALFIQWFWSTFTETVFICSIVFFMTGWMIAGITTAITYLIMLLEYLSASKNAGKTAWLSAILLPITLPWFWIRVLIGK